jgi:hypothetical protein
MDKWLITALLLLWQLGAMGVVAFLGEASTFEPQYRWLLVIVFWPIALPISGVWWLIHRPIKCCLDLLRKRHCHHKFFKCQVPASDSCVAIYHQVCRKCRWDENKGIFMPLHIWRGWAVPQLEKLDEQWNATKSGSMSMDWREWTTSPVEKLDEV